MRKIKRFLYLLGFVGFSVFGVACGHMGTPEQKELDLNQSKQALNGTIQFSGCTASQRTQIQAAMDRLVSQLHPNDHRLLSCMKKAVVEFDNDAPPEEILRRLRENKPTKITCIEQSVSGTRIEAALNISHEELKIYANGYLGDEARLAGDILIAIAKNKGFENHYTHSVPQQLKQCSRFMFPLPAVRTTLPDEAELAHVGGGKAGNPFAFTCANSGFVSSMKIRTSSFWSWKYINQLQATCKSETGAIISNHYVGSTSGTEVSRSCPTGYFLTGVSGYATNGQVNHIRMRCQHISHIKAKSSFSITYTLGGESTSGELFTRYCPAGMAVKQIFGRMGSALYRFRIVCQDIEKERGGWHKLAYRGLTSGTLRDRRCYGFGALTGLRVRKDYYYGYLTMVGGVCTPIKNDNGQFTMYPGHEYKYDHILPRMGKFGDKSLSVSCRDSEYSDSYVNKFVMVGLKVYLGKSGTSAAGRVIGLRPTCAHVNEWHHGRIGSYFTLPAVGNGYGDEHVLTCSLGEFLAGFEVRTGDHLHGIRPICRKLGITGPASGSSGTGCTSNSQCNSNLRCRPTQVSTTGQILERRCLSIGTSGALCDDQNDCFTSTNTSLDQYFCLGISSTKEYGTCTNIGPLEP